MTDRRRFFPAKTVQQVPGQKVEVEVELKKGGEAPPCAPTGFFLGSRKAFLVSQYVERSEYQNWEPDYSLYQTRYDEEWNSTEFTESGTAWITPENHDRYKTEGSESKIEVVQTAAMLAIPIGPSCGLTWSLGWEGYKPNRHIEFSADGPVAIIHVRTIEGVEEYNEGTAILTASCAGKTVGTLRLVIMPDEIW
ncbi:hypothetical protein [Azonexus sp.]|uniref:hypothetical protein n=1 Tax=Azonexus sp. TaxID=1872668 RepID=UPI0039E507F7